MTPEEKIHASLLAAALLLTAGLLAPTASQGSSHALPPPSPPARVEQDLSRQKLERTINQLDALVDAQHRRGGPKKNAIWELQALGYPRISRGPQHSRMTSLLPRVNGSPLSASARETQANALSVLLESGWQLEKNIPFAPDKRPLGDWTVSSLKSFRPGNSPQQLNAIELNLLAMAKMAGLTTYSPLLGDLTRTALLRLRDEYRELGTLRGRGNLPTAGLKTLRAMKSAPNHISTNSLAMSSAALRAAAILQEDALLSLALQHMRNLAFRSKFEISLHRSALTAASDFAARQTALLNALEALGQLGQALHAASLLRPREPGRPLGAVLTVPIIELAGELVELLDTSEWKSLSAEGVNLQTRSLSAATQVLRALRTARIALR